MADAAWSVHTNLSRKILRARGRRRARFERQSERVRTFIRRCYEAIETS